MAKIGDKKKYYSYQVYAIESKKSGSICRNSLLLYDDMKKYENYDELNASIKKIKDMNTKKYKRKTNKNDDVYAIISKNGISRKWSNEKKKYRNIYNKQYFVKYDKKNYNKNYFRRNAFF